MLTRLVCDRDDYMMAKNHGQKCKTIFFPGQLHKISTTNSYKTSWDGDDGDDAYCLYLFYNAK